MALRCILPLLWCPGASRQVVLPLTVRFVGAEFVLRARPRKMPQISASRRAVVHLLRPMGLVPAWVRSSKIELFRRNSRCC